ncbi:uncharacterized protein LOC141906638 isoform X2 [Tubulanus polymorphus]|uniref:uncharacterized protein LOC141906638 isoform X2 n=1 Tax=Tubulanus polymorphus TaxID=672921 RepID=UPI003DA49D5E
MLIAVHAGVFGENTSADMEIEIAKHACSVYLCNPNARKEAAKLTEVDKCIPSCIRFHRCTTAINKYQQDECMTTVSIILPFSTRRKIDVETYTPKCFIRCLAPNRVAMGLPLMEEGETTIEYQARVAKRW